MKASNSLPSAPLVLKLVGTILIVSSLIDYFALLVPPNFSDKAWFAQVVTQIVDRGIIPMVGLAFLFAGSFLENGSLAPRDREAPFSTIRFWALLLAGLLSIIFLIAFPLHLNNTRQVSDQALKRIAEESTGAENQLDTQVQQRQGQIQAALKDPAQIKQLDDRIKQINDAISSGQLKGDQQAQAQQALKELQALKTDPNAIEGRAKDFRNQKLIEIRDRKQQLENQAKGDFWKTGVRVGISSLLLSLGYGIISLMGLREMGIIGGRRKATLR
ncbi:MAG: HpsJ family protein [Myxacorys californica WJT36-NPBG1]|jgi:anti-sigma28 factor (negative regulator of flagellin synthesis)|nr:HpsJ family protein [Myxacorys californica WJT36-NPBG1]